MSKMKKALAMICMICMVLTMLPGMTLKAFAATKTAKTLEEFEALLKTDCAVINFFREVPLSVLPMTGHRSPLRFITKETETMVT